MIQEAEIVETFSAKIADGIVIHERNCFKNFRYINELLEDPVISKYPEKVFTINTDDCATGLLRGIYTSLPLSRYEHTIYRSVPYIEFPNEYVFKNYSNKIYPTFLASWRGNTKSNKIRSKLFNLYKDDDRFCLEKTNSWLNHNLNEKKEYVNLIQKSKFSICPAGWAPVSFRIYESMALGRCPVIIADNFVPPNGIDWKEFALFLPEKDIGNLSDFLLESEHRASRFGEKAQVAWNNHFNSNHILQYYTNSLISLIESSPKSNRLEEFNRWKSFKLRWSNEWTIAQRAYKKLNVLSKVLRM